MANYTILLIDYEPRSIERFREPLVAAGYAIEIATDGISGIEAFHRLNPDMVLVEAMIPKKHGFEVCQELKRTPHGRQTPVLITTGVYKGRKYRTQALHIYGCDEYIEKPIAPEQLLKIVGKFFGSAASAPAPKAAEPADEADPSGRDTRGSLPPSVSSTGTSAPESQGTRLTSVRQHSVVKDGAEDEIIARLDAILPGDGNTTQRSSERETVSAVAEIAETDEDPFAQMRAELNAELGSLSAALAFEPTLAPSDQVPAPSVLEALPSPDAEIPIAPTVPSVPPPSIVADTGSGQVVDFVAKRSRKNKKSRRQDAAPSPKPARIAPAPEPVKLTLPPNTIVASELDPSARRSGMPAWIWAALGAVAIATIYFVFGRSGSSGIDAVSSLPKPAAVAVAPAESRELSEVTVTPVPNGPLDTASAAVEPTPQRVPESSKPVPGALAVPTPKKATDRAAKVPVATVPAPKPPVVAPESGAIAKSKPAKIAPKIDAAKETRPEATAPPTLEDTVAGVEAAPELAAPSPTTTIEPGTLIPIDTADTMPVALSHRVPVYSLQARQMRLSGTVVMNVLVNERGTVDQVVLVNGVSGAGVNEATMQAAESWTYRPAMKNGVPVKVWKSEQVIFKL
jgi:TonB family protein